MKLFEAIRKFFIGCDHNYVVVHSDNTVHVERCTKCGDEVRYGG